MYEKAVSMQYVTNPVRLTSFLLYARFSFPFLISHTISPADLLHPSRVPLLKKQVASVMLFVALQLT